MMKTVGIVNVDRFYVPTVDFTRGLLPASAGRPNFGLHARQLGMASLVFLDVQIGCFPGLLAFSDDFQVW